MVGTKAQDKGAGRESVSRRVSLSTARSNPADPLSKQPAVGEGYVTPLSESRDAGDPHVRFDERDLETELLSYRARSRLYHEVGSGPFMPASTLTKRSEALSRIPAGFAGPSTDRSPTAMHATI